MLYCNLACITSQDSYRKEGKREREGGRKEGREGEREGGGGRDECGMHEE
jgi:hypothetical protein